MTDWQRAAGVDAISADGQGLRSLNLLAGSRRLQPLVTGAASAA
jgi:hypothetical protein